MHEITVRSLERDWNARNYKALLRRVLGVDLPIADCSSERAAREALAYLEQTGQGQVPFSHKMRRALQALDPHREASPDATWGGATLAERIRALGRPLAEGTWDYLNGIGVGWQQAINAAAALAEQHDRRANPNSAAIPSSPPHDDSISEEAAWGDYLAAARQRQYDL